MTYGATCSRMPRYPMTLSTMSVALLILTCMMSSALDSLSGIIAFFQEFNAHAFTRPLQAQKAEAVFVWHTSATAAFLCRGVFGDCKMYGIKVWRSMRKNESARLD